MKSTSVEKPTRTKRPIRVLLVEDSVPDSILLIRALERGGFEPTYERVDTKEGLQAALARQSWDLVLADHAMPRFSAPEALAMVKNQGLDLPFVIVSGYIEEETAVATMRAGAHDYVMKDRLGRLAPAVERELREAEVRRARDESQASLRRAHEELETRVEQRTADLKVANIKLQRVIRERKRLENELLEIADNERRRIAFDLHDELGQMLTGMTLMVKGLQQKLASQRHPCAEDASRVQQLVEQITAHAHNLAHRFSSLDATGDDLSGLLSGLAQNVEKMFELSCNFSLEGGLPELPNHTTVQLYKIAQEAVSNAIKHGKATWVAIQLANANDFLTMTIKNDGVPFSEPGDARNRMGLRIMGCRASTVGAEFKIKPMSRNGTVVTCALSLKSRYKTAPRTVEALVPGLE